MQALRKNLTTGEVSQLLGVTVNCVKKWIYKGKLRAFRTPGGHFRITEEEFDRLAHETGLRHDEVIDTRDSKDRLLTTGDVARCTGVSTTTVKKWARSGKLRAIHLLGGHRRIALSALREFLAGRGTVLDESSFSK